MSQPSPTPPNDAAQRPFPPTPTAQRRAGLALVAGMLLFVAAWLGAARAAPSHAALQRATAVFAARDAVDLNQPRINSALPTPRGDLLFEQSFTPRWNGLYAIDLTLVRYGEPPAEGDNGRFILRLLAEDGALIAEQTLATAGVVHNQAYQLRLPPQPRSAGQRYRLQLAGSADNPVSAWGYNLDVYGGGGLRAVGSDVAALALETRDLRFTTRYRLTFADALRALGAALYYEGALLLLALLFLPLPGALLLQIHPPGHDNGLDDGAAWWGAALALGVTTWPLLWLWLSFAGGRWWGWLLWLAVAAGWLTAAALWLLRRRRTGAAAQPAGGWGWHTAVLLALVLLGLAVRLLAVRDVAFPPWVDAGRHALITAVMTQTGQAISSYAPFLPVARFPYHFGFHTLSSSLQLMSGWPLERLLLYLGQLLNGLAPLTLYAATWLLTRRRGASLLAAFLAALPFFFPAYYATWGRMTQLTAVLVLPVLLAYTWRLLAAPEGRRAWWAVGLLAAGLFLIHFRVFLFYLPFAALAWLLHAGRNGRWLLAATALGGLLVTPRVAALLAEASYTAELSAGPADYNAFPLNYLTAGWEQAFAWLAGAGLLVVIAAALARRRWARLPLLLAAWVAALFLLLNADRAGLPSTMLVNVGSMFITLFVPLAIFLALLADGLGGWLLARPWPLRDGAALLAGAALAAAALFGVRQQSEILNRQTILAEAADLPAIAWAAGNLPPDARLAVNSWRWLGETWAAADGGGWLPPLTGRATTTPPVDYIYDLALFQEVRAFNQAATAVADWSDPAQAEWLRAQGVTHIYVGARGGFFDPAALARNPQLRMVYGRDGVFIFEILP